MKSLVVVALTRVARRVFNSANVPRLGVPPSLLLYFAALNTLRTTLCGVGCITEMPDSQYGTKAVQLRWGIL